MVRILRFLGFLISAIGVQIATGVGAVALMIGLALGWFRWNVVWILAPTIAGAICAHLLFEDVATGGKVVNALSNVAFELIVYFIICALGYAIGAIARRWR
jgi:hypothetical protein